MIIFLGTLIIPVHAATLTIVKVDPLSQTISSGSTFTISIACAPVQSIKSFEFKVVYNPSLLTANSVSKGNIFKSYTTFFNAGTIDNVGGTIKNIYDVILGTSSVSSSGTLVTISFTAKSTSGTSSINLNNVGITNNLGYLPITITNGSVQILKSNKPPVYDTMFPANKSSNIPISSTSLSVTIRDPEGDHFNYTIQTRPNVGSVSIKNVVNGTKSCTISGLKYATTYRWYVNATDGHSWTRQWYTFTTASGSINSPLVFSGGTPSNGSANIPISTSSISLVIKDPEGDHFNYTIQTRPNVGSVSIKNVVNGTKSCTISGLKYATTYRWYVNATDGHSWTRQWYTFTTAQNPANNPFIFSGANPSDGSTNIPISTSKITLTVQNSKGHAFNMNIKTSPDIGSSSRMNAFNGSKTLSISGLTYGATYHWYVSCKDVSNGQWANQSYWFTTESDPAGGNPPSGGDTPSNETEPPSIPEHNNPPNPPTKPIGPTFVERGVNYYYVSSAFDPDNDTIRMQFDWGDGTYSNWTGFVPANITVSLSHTWMNISTYNITVIAQDEHGQNSSWSNPFNIIIAQSEEVEQAIVKIITSSDNISTNESIQFDASYCFVPGNTIVSYQWEFGDGKRNTGKTTHYSYTTPGQYEVTLTITDDQGETYNNKIIVTVAAGAEVVAQNAMSFLSILITSGLIGIVVILIFILVLLSRRTMFLQLGKKYLTYGRKWIKPFTTKITELKHTKVITPEPKPKITIPQFDENRTIHTLLQSTPTEENEQNIDDILLQKIHEKIDRL